jgi:peptidoglycan/LPS O-acetylase OafA/YrhL
MQERLQELDLLRAVALLGVLVIHASAWAAPVAASPASGAIPALSDLARCSIPAFVLASGFALQLRRRPGLAAGKFLKRRALRTLVPWTIWAAIFLGAGLVNGGHPALDQPHVLRWLAAGAGHLYFLLLVMQLYLVWLLLPTGRRALAITAAGALAVQLALGAVHTYAPAPPEGALAWVGGQLSYFEAPYYAGYFVAGALLAELWPDLRRHGLLLPAAAAATAVAATAWLLTGAAIPADPRLHGTYAFLWPGRTPLVLAGSVLVLGIGAAGRERVPQAVHGAVEWLGSRSLGVYVSHPIALMIFGPFALSRLPAWPRVGYLVAVSLAFGWAVVKVLGESRGGAIALGEEPPPRVRQTRRAIAPA